MIPTSFSASSMQVAQKCMTRWKVEYLHKVKGSNNEAADLGTVCHAALEDFVTQCYINEKKMPAELIVLKTLYTAAFKKYFGPDISHKFYSDGMLMMENWHANNALPLKEVEVLSTESKEVFELPTPAGKIPFNFIMDRLDKLGPTEYEVIDYKSQRYPISTEQLKGRLQAKVYALAVQIKFPDAEKIWVTFDLLRHKPVTVLFSKEENAVTWRTLKAIAKGIIETEEDNTPETINSECIYCLRKATCETLLSNLAIGSSASLTMSDTVALAKDLEHQASAIKTLREELEEMIMQHAAEHDILTWQEDSHRVTITQNSNRAVRDPELAAELIGKDLLKKYGFILNVGTVDSIIKKKEVSSDIAKKLSKLIPKTPGKISVNIEKF